MNRGLVERSTKETSIRLELSPVGQMATSIRTPIGFLDHMLDLLARQEPQVKHILTGNADAADPDDEAVRQSITRLRRLMFDLRPPTLDRTGLGPALRELLEQVRAETEIEYSLDDRLATEPSSDVRIELYRICQEALANIRKHSMATHVKIELQRVEQGCHVRVVDDGSGFDVSIRSGQPGHLGLVAMRERATIAGGWWKIESKPSGGTVVDFWLPDDREAESAEGVDEKANGGLPRRESLEAPR